MKKTIILLTMFLLSWLGVANAVDTLTFTIGDTAAPHNRDYRYLADAETLNLNLAESLKVCVFECYNDFAGVDDDSGLVIDGWTVTDSTYLLIRALSSERHPGIFDTTKYLWASDYPTNAFTLQDAYIHLEGLQIEGRATGTQVVVRIYASSSVGCVISDCIIRKANTGGSSNMGIIIASSGLNTTVKNCLIDATYMLNGVKEYYATGAFSLCNCTIYGATAAGLVGGTGVNVNAVNCLVYNNLTDFSGSFDTANCSNNFSKDATAVGASSIHGDSEGKTPDFVSVIADAEDFHLQSTSDAIGVGVGPDVNANVPTADIDGDARSGATCDIGFDEYVAAGGGQGVRRISGVNVKGVSVK